MAMNMGIINTSATTPMIGFNHKPHMLMSTNGNTTNISGISGTPPNIDGRVQPLNTGSPMLMAQLSQAQSRLLSR